jgi:hypothetical protein
VSFPLVLPSAPSDPVDEDYLLQTRQIAIAVALEADHA